MTGFYVSVILFGVLVVFVALALIFSDRRKGINYSKAIDQKSKQLVDIIKDAEQMIEEMDKFSDYIIRRFESKNDEIKELLCSIDKKVEYLNAKQMEWDTEKEVVLKKTGTDEDYGYHYVGRKNFLEKQGVMFRNSVNNKKQNVKKTEKVIEMNSRHKEVLDMAETGFDETYIAKTLNIGKGEIGLILQMNRL